jgi:serine/threonine protein phosphatase PrpC
LALETLQTRVAHDVPFDVVAVMEDVQDRLLQTFYGSLLTTGSLVHVDLSVSEPVMTFAAAGDSPIYRFDHNTKSLHRETFDESQRIGNAIDASNFLGSDLHVLSQVGRLLLTGDTTVLIMSDGITDNEYEGHATDESIGSILEMHAKPQDIARELMDSVPEFDDASIVALTIRKSE